VKRAQVRRAVLIAGPTASGKSALAMALAARFGGIVINGDSMQVYRDLRLLTARPTITEEQEVPHALFGHVDAAENYSVGRYVGEVAKILADLPQETLPILTGGTGLYLRALLSGLAAIPPIDPQIRETLRRRLDEEGVAVLFAELGACDPDAASRIMPRDQARILRALEVFQATGRPISDWHREGMVPVIDPDRAIKIFLHPNRSELKKRINTRFGLMMEQGALDEVRALDARGLPDTLPAMRAHGVPWLRKFLHGEMSREDAIEGSIMDTRRYAKRQVTWFRNQMPGWHWTSPDEAMDVIAQQLQKD